ncbi:MAG: low-specificity L-threonine aldolase [Chloroflexi bacterium]|nr:low-specificity L-threonine aldolase [Chloroflexota bacterium]PWB42653.1 MAG: low-specificity L-threonine aldolase [Dehalococcoidia bacterium]
MNAVIDLRSDTVSKPSDAMRHAMASAEVGDDVFGDDPTVRALEERAAGLLGKEAALFVPSGTMANLLAVMTHTRPGDEILLGDQCHIFQYELGGAARIANVLTRPLANHDDGAIAPDAVAAAIRQENLHSPGTTLLCLENTHNRCGGAALPVTVIDELAAVARERKVAVHLDGARVFNAAAALGVPAARIARDCDSVSFCLSKGLGCPVGSLLCGPGQFIERARRNRKLLGGGMRQVGILAAAGLYALDHNITRLSEDHANARVLADGLRKLAPFRTNDPATNIVVADITEGRLPDWLAAFEQQGVLAVAFGPQRMRLVTHINITRNDVDQALARIASIAGAVPV